MGEAKHFEDFMNLVSGGQEKIASTDSVGESLLEKLAAELGSGGDLPAKVPGAGAAAPAKEGDKQPAASSVTDAPSAVAAATDAVAVPQEVAAGADPAEKPAGEQTPATKPNEGVVISAGDGKSTKEVDGKQADAKAESEKTTGQTETAKHAAADGTVAVPEGEIEKTAEIIEAENVGRAMARAYADEMTKMASEQEYAEAYEILKEAELLDGYTIEEPELLKTASVESGGLEKIANKEVLGKKDIVSAAVEYIEKTAEMADEAGREAARKDFADAEAEVAAVPETEKTASAIDLLIKKGVLKVEEKPAETSVAA